MLEIEVDTHINAPPSRVWELIGDPTRMGDWSPECKRVNWTRRATRPELGARFKGHNRNGWHRWSTTGTLVAYEPGREVAWEVSFGPLAVARWGYRLEPDGTGLHPGRVVRGQARPHHRVGGIRGPRRQR